MPQLASQIHTIEEWLQAMTGAMTCRHRADGTSYYVLSDAEHWSDIHDTLQDVVRGAHFGEMPNDWRFSMVDSICHRLLEYSEPETKIWSVDDYGEIAFQVADVLTEVSTAQLLHWLADDCSRCQFDDEGLVDGMLPDLARLAQFRQCEEIQKMVLFIVDAFSHLLQYRQAATHTAQLFPIP
jgi:hypothetical protein